LYETLQGPGFGQGFVVRWRLKLYCGVEAMASKMRSIKMIIDLEVSYDESLDDEYVKNKYLFDSDRCSTVKFRGEPGLIITSIATAEVTEINGPSTVSCWKKNPEFFEALCQDGVIEWLEPLVLGKSSTSVLE
jgi:hypothetical protein